MPGLLIRDAKGPYGRKKRDGQLDIPEHLLARLWQRRAAQQAWFRAQGGPKMRVIYPGRQSHTAGPDFRDALLEVEGLGLVQGDVEIHVRQQDWDSHGHGNDPRYNGVVLHAALEVHSSATELHSGGQATVVSLAPLFSGQEPPVSGVGDALWQLLAKQGHPRPYTAQEAGALLDRAGDQRFTAKSLRYKKFLEEQSPDQTLYEGILEGLGYRQNQNPFVQLAQRARYASLERAAGQLPQEMRAQAIEIWLARLSGLLPPGKAQAGPLPRAGFGKPLSAEIWHCFRVRPANHPLRRIAGAAAIVARFLEPGLVAGLSQAAENGKPKVLTSALTVSAGLAGGPAPVGQVRARDLAVNVILPLLHAQAATPDQPEAGEAYLELYRRFPKLQENELTREMAGQLLPPAWRQVVVNARRQQGLLHLHHLLSGFP